MRCKNEFTGSALLCLWTGPRVIIPYLRYSPLQGPLLLLGTWYVGV